MYNYIIMADEFSPAEVKKRGPERHLTKKYNFAGPGTEFRARMKGSDFYEKMMKDAGRAVVGSKPYDKPYDKLDKCGVAHDTVYARKDATAAEVKQADRDFQKCAQKITAADGIELKIRSLASRAGFEGKIALESLGVLRKGSFASGGDKSSTIGQKLKQVASLGAKHRRVMKKGIKLVDM